MCASDGSSFLPFSSHPVRDGDGNTQPGEKAPSLMTAPHNNPKLCILALTCFFSVQVDEKYNWLDRPRPATSFCTIHQDISKATLTFLIASRLISASTSCSTQRDLRLCHADTNYREKGQENKSDIYILQQRCFPQSKVNSTQ